MLSRRVHKNIDPQERIAVFRVGFVQVSKIHAHSPLPASFLNNHHVCQPVGVINLLNEARLLQFAYFFRYGLILLRGEHSLLLSDGWKGRRYIQPVYHDRRVYFWHVFMAPGECVSIAPEKSYELLADCGISEGSNFGRSVKIGIVKGYLFKFLYRLYHHMVLFYIHGLDLISHSIVGRELNH